MSIYFGIVQAGELVRVTNSLDQADSIINDYNKKSVQLAATENNLDLSDPEDYARAVELSCYDEDPYDLVIINDDRFHNDQIIKYTEDNQEEIIIYRSEFERLLSKENNYNN